MNSATTAGTVVGTITMLGGQQLLKRVPWRVYCDPPKHSFEMDRFFAFTSDDYLMNSQTLADAVVRNKAWYNWCVAIANWGKYLFGLGLALVGSFGVWYFSTLQREMANRLWPAFVFGALPMLVVGYVGRVVAAFLFMGAAGYGHFATMSYWEAEIVNNSIHPLTPLLVDRADVKELIGDWGNNLKPHLETYEITTHILHFGSEPKREDFPRAANGFVFVLTGSGGQALVRVFTELNFVDKKQYEEQISEFFEQVDHYSYNLFRFLQPFSRSPGPYPSIPQFHMKGVELQYVDVVCVAGPKRGQRVVLLDNMDRYANIPQFLDLNKKENKKK